MATYQITILNKSTGDIKTRLNVWNDEVGEQKFYVHEPNKTYNWSRSYEDGHLLCVRTKLDDSYMFYLPPGNLNLTWTNGRELQIDNTSLKPVHEYIHR
ncbi:MAG: hypothetical protein HRT37_21180 [Alteromonadaceae bacterium]|nr:hypothetical protein [Alteromonadaceae bacterium]